MKRFFLLLFIAFPCLIFAGGFQLNLQGLKAVGMGGAFAGVVSDASAVFYNPAGMSRLNGHNFIVGINIVDANVSLQTPETANINQTSKKGTPFHFYYVGKLNEKINFGFLVNNQFGSSASFDNDWQGKFIIQNISLKTFMFQPTMSYKILDKLSVGGGFVYTYGEFSTEKAIPVSSSTITNGEASLSGSGDGVGFNIGVYSQFLTLGETDGDRTEFAAGIDYRSKMAVDLANGTAKFTDIPVSLKNKFPAQTSFVSKLTLPAVFTFGISIKRIVKDKWSLEFAYDLNWTGWSSYDTLAFDFKNADTPDSKQIQDWKDVLTHRLGFDFTYKNKYSVRVGLYLDNTPMKDNLISPHLPGVTQVAYTAGLGYRISDKVSVDFAYIRQSASRDNVGLAQYEFKNGNFVQNNGSLVQTGEFKYKFNRKVNVYGLAFNFKFGGAKTQEKPTVTE